MHGPIEKHVAICIPCMDKPHMQFSQSLACLMYQCGRRATPIVMIHQSGSLITRARNQCLEQIEIYEKQGIVIEWILFIDSDMVFPPDTLHTMLMHQKDIIGCTYVRRSPPFDVHGRTLEGKPISTEGKILIEMAGLPTGMLLIRREVFRKLKRPYFREMYQEETGTLPPIQFGEDYVFCARAREAGYKIHLEVELSKKVGHIAERILYVEEDGWPELKEKIARGEVQLIEAR